eukprot:2049288-Pyramimonas_sp.AAC.2
MEGPWWANLDRAPSPHDPKWVGYCCQKCWCSSSGQDVCGHDLSCAHTLAPHSAFNKPVKKAAASSPAHPGEEKRANTLTWQ